MSDVLSIRASQPPTGRTVLIVGSGAGGMAAAIDLAIDGWDVFVTDPYLAYVPDPGELRYVGASGSGSVDVAPSGVDANDAVGQAALVVIATLATAAADVVEMVAPSLRPGQTVVAACGGLTSLAFEKVLGADSGVLIGELACFPYSSRFRTDGSVNIRRRRPVRLAASAPGRTPELGKAVPTHWVGSPAASALHAAVLNPNYVVHPASVVINLASRDRAEDVPHEGLTAGAWRIAAEIDRDKCALLAGLGLPKVSLAEMMEEMDRRGSKARVNGPDPNEPILDRYLTEDCGMGLSLLVELAQVVGVELPTIGAIRDVLAVALADQLPEFPFDLVGATPSQLVNGGNT